MVWEGDKSRVRVVVGVIVDLQKGGELVLKKDLRNKYCQLNIIENDSYLLKRNIITKKKKMNYPGSLFNSTSTSPGRKTKERRVKKVSFSS